MTLRDHIRQQAEQRARDHDNFERVWREAVDLGHKAGVAIVPRPMTIRGYEPVLDGVCGFAWVKVRPANSRFANWLKKVGIVSGPAYNGGVDIWISDHNQSYERKLAHAEALAEHLRSELGIDAKAHGRLD